MGKMETKYNCRFDGPELHLAASSRGFPALPGAPSAFFSPKGLDYAARRRKRWTPNKMSRPAARRTREAGSGTEVRGVTLTVYWPKPLPDVPHKLKLPIFITGVEEEEGHEKSCWPTRAKLFVPTTPPPSKLLKTIVRCVHVPFTSTGKEENQNAREFPALGVGCAARVKLALKVPLVPGPVI
jgi:hypothetical protein